MEQKAAVHKLNLRRNASKSYTPDNRTGDADEDPVAIDEHDEAANESGVPDQAKDAGALTGTNRDETGSSKNMATAS